MTTKTETHPYIDADPQLWIDSESHRSSWRDYRSRSATAQVYDRVVAGRILRHIQENLDDADRPQNEAGKRLKPIEYACQLTGDSPAWVRLGAQLADVRWARNGQGESDFPPEWDGLTPEQIRKGGYESLLNQELTRHGMGPKKPKPKAPKPPSRRRSSGPWASL